MIVVMTAAAAMAPIVVEIIMTRKRRNAEQAMIGGRKMTAATAGIGEIKARILNK